MSKHTPPGSRFQNGRPLMFATQRQTALTPSNARGFTLVEVLIALIIMSVGMLGIAGLYVHSMAAGRTSIFRHHAVTLAGDVADRIRANPSAGVAYEGAGVNNNCVTGGVDCTPVEMAQNDIFLWQRAVGAVAGVDGALPNGNIAVDFTDVADPAPDTYRITVTWSEAGAAVQPTYVFTVPINDFTDP